jgi:hypothetical protein
MDQNDKEKNLFIRTKFSVEQFTYESILEATGNFSIVNKLGECSFGGTMFGSLLMLEYLMLKNCVLPPNQKHKQFI